MKREEKNLQSRQKIIDAALREFAQKSYAEASLNTICSDGGVSKGIIYHYFKDKDALYLGCVRLCFDALTAYLRDHVTTDSDCIETDLQHYFDARMTFFDQNPLYLKLFYSAVITPPAHLTAEIAALREQLDALNVDVLTTLLHRVTLRPDVTLLQVVNDFRLYQDFINTRYQMQSIDPANMEEREKQCRRTLSILLYGAVARGEIPHE